MTKETPDPAAPGAATDAPTDARQPGGDGGPGWLAHGGRAAGRAGLFGAPIIGAMLLVFGMNAIGARGEGDGPETSATPVRVATLEPQTFAATASGFGRVQAETTWEAISQVEGRVTALLPEFGVGLIVEEDASIATIDRRDYEIAQAKAEANLASAQAELEELNAQEANTANSLALERRIEAFLQTSFERAERLARSGAATAAASDDAQRALLAQNRVVLELENQLALYGVQRVTLQATIDTRAVELEEAQRDLARTEFTAPFRGRVSEEAVAFGQFVRVGDRLLTLESLATAEVTALVQPAALRNMVLSLGPELLTRLVAAQASGRQNSLIRELGLTASVHVVSGDDRFVWPAEIVRVTGRADETTGALSVVVRILEPSRPNLELRRPPLSNGTFVEVRLTAPERSGLILPRSAIRSDAAGQTFVYLMDAERRLRRRDVAVGPRIEDAVLIRDGLEPGETVVLSDLRPPVLGMALEPAPAPVAGEAPAEPDPSVEAAPPAAE